MTPLSVASFNGNIEVCIYLLEIGAKVDAGYQPLFGAAGVNFLYFSFPRMAIRM
jgi:ankyrin repeat protein